MSDREKQIIGKNLKHLRRIRNMTQQELADELGIRRSNIGAYEECRATPRYETLERISEYFSVSIDMLVKEDLSSMQENDWKNVTPNGRPDYEGSKLRILAVPVGADGKENISVVNNKASAGYLNGLADPEYIEQLPNFHLPMLGTGTYRAFEVKGDSMLPIRSGTMVVCEYVENWRDIKEGQTYVVISPREGIVYKRLSLRNSREGAPVLILRSDNPLYPPQELPLDEVKEIWKAKLYMSEQFPEPDLTLERIYAMVQDLQQELARLKHQR
jgi:transcriptional regulator with XRE-family HTH domain